MYCVLCVCVVVFVVVCLWLRVRGCVGCVLCSRLYVVVCVLRVCVCGCVLAVVMLLVYCVVRVCQYCFVG